MLLPNNSGQLIRSGYGEPQFRAEAKERMPELAEDVESCAGLLHPVMGVFAAAGRDAIVSGDLDLLQRLFTFVASVVERSDADPEIESAVELSFLEQSDFEGPGGQAALELLPDRLRTLIYCVR